MSGMPTPATPRAGVDWSTDAALRNGFFLAPLGQVAERINRRFVDDRSIGARFFWSHPSFLTFIR
jgi:hypothetical protein